MGAASIMTNKSFEAGYTSRGQNHWAESQAKAVPLAELLEKSGMSRSAVFEVLAGRSVPHPKNREQLAEIVRKQRFV